MGGERNKIKSFKKAVDKNKKLRYTIVERRQKRPAHGRTNRTMEAGQAGVMSPLNRQDPKGERETTSIPERTEFERAEVTKKKTKTRLKIENGGTEQ